MTLPKRVKVYEALSALYAKQLMYIPVRKIAQRANVPVSTASTELKYLEVMGLVVRKGSRGGWKPRYIYERTYRHLLDLYRRGQGFVKLQTIADLESRSKWTVWEHLRRLRSAGLVVMGNGGWKPKRRDDIVPASVLVLDVLSQLYVDGFSFVRTVEIAQRLKVSSAHVRDVLRDYEESGRVERKGSRGGWKPKTLVLSAEL